jgi:hypothetical protein
MNTTTIEDLRAYGRALAITAALALIALTFVIHPAPWSELGKANQHPPARATEVPVEIPDGWTPHRGPVYSPERTGTPT